MLCSPQSTFLCVAVAPGVTVVAQTSMSHDDLAWHDDSMVFGVPPGTYNVSIQGCSGWSVVKEFDASGVTPSPSAAGPEN